MRIFWQLPSVSRPLPAPILARARERLGFQFVHFLKEMRYAQTDWCGVIRRFRPDDRRGGFAGIGSRGQILLARQGVGLPRKLPVLNLPAMHDDGIRHIRLLRHQSTCRIPRTRALPIVFRRESIGDESQLDELNKNGLPFGRPLPFAPRTHAPRTQS